MTSNNSSSSISSVVVFQREICRLDGINYRVWKVQMETHLRCLGKEIWGITKKGYIPHNLAYVNSLLIGLDKDIKNDCRAREAILCALSDQQIMGLINKSTTKAIWDKLETLNEGEPTIKIVKLDGYRERYENLNIEEDEMIYAFMERVNELF